MLFISKGFFRYHVQPYIKSKIPLTLLNFNSGLDQNVSQKYLPKIRGVTLV